MSTITPPPDGITFIPYFPGSPLARHVVMLWYVHGHVPYIRERILPTEHVELIINFGAPRRTYLGMDSDRFDVTSDAGFAAFKPGSSSISPPA